MLCNHIILPFSLYANRSDTNNTRHAGGPCEASTTDMRCVYVCVSLKSLHNQQLSSVQELGHILGGTANSQEGSTRFLRQICQCISDISPEEASFTILLLTIQTFFL